MGKVSVLYSNLDAEIAETLIEELSGAGYGVDAANPFERGNPIENLHKARAIIIIWTKAALQSRNIVRLAKAAHEEGKLVSIVADGIAVSDLPLPHDKSPCLKIGDRTGVRRALHSLGIQSGEAGCPIEVTVFERLVNYDVAGNVCLDLDYVEGDFTREEGWHFEVFFDDMPNRDTFQNTRISELYLKHEGGIVWSWYMGKEEEEPGLHFCWLLLNDLMQGIADIDQLEPGDDKPYTKRKDPYDRVWDIMKKATTEFKSARILDHEIPPALADYLLMSVLAMGNENGLSEQAALAIIRRMENMLDDWRHGRPPFQENNGTAKLN